MQHNAILGWILPRIVIRPIKRIESRKNLKPTGFGLRMERIKPPLVVENPEDSKLDRVSVVVKI